ncbi:glutamic acid-rich protein-like isoform X1 [Diorhabda sublineata]|uniref:glutamic acid-rich protein-like isoform X1 n=2 Tax=Diorhabda sublineata TaxID=1163346 RepID=UPI0024E18119|nr:glutamic acid-rich protein-like isoform X1 [Diorhabda sublineata]
MAIDLKFSKSDASSNWGFRIVGGADFQQPLIVVKVNEGSLAEQAGLQRGDIIVKINELSTSILTHSEVQQAISSAGLKFTLRIKRGESIPFNLLQDEGKEVEIVMRDVQVSVDESVIERAEKIAEQLGKEIFEEFGKHKTTKSNTKGSVEKMVFSNSTQTFFNTEEKYKQKKWSTFLMKPERPPPKPRKTMEEQKRTDNGYKIIIKKQSRRKSLPKEKRVQFDQNVLEIEHVGEDDSCSPEVSLTPDLDNYESQPDPDSLEEDFRDQIEEENYEEKNGNDGKCSDSNSEQCSDCENNVEVDPENGFEHLRRDSLGQHITYKPISEIIVDPNSENAMTLEEQLRTVQKQLEALSQLPSSVQVTLDAVSKQIAQIFNLEETENENKEQCFDEEEEERYVDDDKESTEAAEAETGDDTNSIIADELEEDSLTDKEITDLSKEEDLDEINKIREEEELEARRKQQEREEELEAQRKQEEILAKQEKEMEKKPNFRPIVLPGGRKWIDPDDVVPTRKPKMSDEKIMESIESSLEVISGKRKGINFMKYTPPARNLDHLQRSEVYRLIHDSEKTATSRGIVARPEKILPEQDYYEATKSQQ